MGSGFLKRKKEARAMQEQIEQMRSKMETMEMQGSSGNGLVTITLNGEGVMKQIKIKPDCVDKEDLEGLEDLIKAAYHDAKKKVEATSMQGMPGLSF
jgi:nucleoid-associated protein EbfC